MIAFSECILNEKKEQISHTLYEMLFLPLLRRFNPAEPVVGKSVIL